VTVSPPLPASPANAPEPKAEARGFAELHARRRSALSPPRRAVVLAFRCRRGDPAASSRNGHGREYAAGARLRSCLSGVLVPRRHRPLRWPAWPSLAVKFVAHRLYDRVKHESDSAHGMPAAVAGALRASGTLKTDWPHAAATVKRRLSL
jgi:hypothetical protein